MGFWEDVAALCARLGALSYFELLEIEPGADALALRDAYHAMLRRYHPDRSAGATPAQQRQLAVICARVGEAYRCLSHPVYCASYLAQLAGGQVRSRQTRRSTISDHRDPRGLTARSLLDGARQLRGRGNRAGARAKLELALQFEPDSAVLRHELDALARPGGTP